MDEAGGKVLLPPGRVLQLLDVLLHGVRHVVEALRQLADLVAARDFGPGGVVPLGQLGGHPPQGADGRGQPVGEGEHHQTAGPHHQQDDPPVDLIVDLPVVEQAADVPDGLHVEAAVRQGHGPRAVEQVPPGGILPAQDVPGGAGPDLGEQLLIAGGVQGGIDVAPRGGGDPEAAVREVGGLRQGALQAPSPLRRVLQGDAPGVADGLEGDAKHLHLLLGHVDLPLQGGLEGEGDEQIAADPGAEQQDAQRRQGDLPGEPHSGTSSR